MLLYDHLYSSIAEPCLYTQALERPLIHKYSLTALEISLIHKYSLTMLVYTRIREITYTQVKLNLTCIHKP